MVWKPGGVGESCVDDAKCDIVEAVADAGKREELNGGKRAEDLDEDL